MNSRPEIGTSIFSENARFRHTPHMNIGIKITMATQSLEDNGENKQSYF